jgi:hypothetical protein
LRQELVAGHDDPAEGVDDSVFDRIIPDDHLCIFVDVVGYRQVSVYPNGIRGINQVAVHIVGRRQGSVFQVCGIKRTFE